MQHLAASGIALRQAGERRRRSSCPCAARRSRRGTCRRHASRARRRPSTPSPAASRSARRAPAGSRRGRARATSGRSTCSQNVQFQPSVASSGDATCVRWPPKKTSPRAPVDDRLVGHEALGLQRREARHELRLVVRRRHAAPRDLKRHPDRLRAGRADHLPRHVADDADVAVAGLRVRAGRVRDRVDVGAGDVERRAGTASAAATVPIGAWVIDDRMRRVELLQPLVGADHPGRPDPVRAAERVARLVDPLVRAERRMALDAVRDPREQPLLRRRLRGRRRQVRRRRRARARRAGRARPPRRAARAAPRAARRPPRGSSPRGRCARA